MKEYTLKELKDKFFPNWDIECLRGTCQHEECIDLRAVLKDWKIRLKDGEEKEEQAKIY